MTARSRVPAHARPPRVPGGTLLTGPALLAVVLVAMVLTAGSPAAAPGRHALPAARDTTITLAAAGADISLADQSRALREQAAALAWYTVKPGDTLSQIAGARCGAGQDWTGLYAANRDTVGRDPDEIAVHTRLHIECTYVPGLLRLADPPVYRAAVAALADVTPASTEQGAYSSGSQPDSYQAPSGNYGGTPGGSFGQCVVDRESGGDSQVMNSSGHYGLYQFSASTWAAYGGNPDSFGNASVAEQEQVFANALAQGGERNWSQYDGCTP